MHEPRRRFILRQFLVFTVRIRLVAKIDSMELVVRKCCR